MLLFGYANGERYTIEPSVEQICAFVMKFRYVDRTIITDMFDLPYIETSMGFLMYCADQELLRASIIPMLAPMQMGEVEAPEFKPLVEDELEDVE